MNQNTQASQNSNLPNESNLDQNTNTICPLDDTIHVELLKKMPNLLREHIRPTLPT